jgi:hypothetical protein
MRSLGAPVDRLPKFTRIDGGRDPARKASRPCGQNVGTPHSSFAMEVWPIDAMYDEAESYLQTQTRPSLAEPRPDGYRVSTTCSQGMEPRGVTRSTRPTLLHQEDPSWSTSTTRLADMSSPAERANGTNDEGDRLVTPTIPTCLAPPLTTL